MVEFLTCAHPFNYPFNNAQSSYLTLAFANSVKDLDGAKTGDDPFDQMAAV